METPYELQQVQIFVHIQDQWHGEPTYLAIVRYLRRHGAAGVTVLRGMLGFGASLRLHADSLAELPPRAPILVLWVDRPDRITRLLPEIQAMLQDGLIVTNLVTAFHVQRRIIDAFPQDLTVRDVMSPNVPMVGPGTPVTDVADLVLHGDAPMLPIVDGDHRVLGVVTDGDLLRRGQLALPFNLRVVLSSEELAAATPATPLYARDIMTRDVVSASADLPIAAAVGLMAQWRFKGLPVLDRHRQLVGIVSRADILQTIARVVPQLAPQPTISFTIRRVADVMQSDIRTVYPNSPLTAVVDALVAAQHRRVVVVGSAGQALGMITDGDIIRRASA